MASIRSTSRPWRAASAWRSRICAGKRKVPRLPALSRTSVSLRSWYKRLRRRRIHVADGDWAEALARTPCAQALPDRERRRLRELAGQFLASKRFEGTAGFEIDASVRAVVAAKACLPVLHLGLDFYAGWSDIVVYPGDFRVHDEYMDEAGVVHRETRDLCGQSLSQGPMVLSWAAIEEESESIDRDLVIHECAHKLDVLNGPADGFPPLHAGMSARAWSDVFTKAYERFGEQVEQDDETGLDPYGASDPAEFFAVASETFFTAPGLIRDDFPDVYAQLARFYRLDTYALLGDVG
nr:M90 family metallopeptidase [Sulfurifustis variabilis]